VIDRPSQVWCADITFIAIEGRNTKALASFYADDAVMSVKWGLPDPSHSGLNRGVPPDSSHPFSDDDQVGH
jgi:hypothetical protein